MTEDENGRTYYVLSIDFGYKDLILGLQKNVEILTDRLDLANIKVQELTAELSEYTK